MWFFVSTFFKCRTLYIFITADSCSNSSCNGTAASVRSPARTCRPTHADRCARLRGCVNKMLVSARPGRSSGVISNNTSFQEPAIPEPPEFSLGAHKTTTQTKVLSPPPLRGPRTRCRIGSTADSCAQPPRGARACARRAHARAHECPASARARGAQHCGMQRVFGRRGTPSTHATPSTTNP